MSGEDDQFSDILRSEDLVERGPPKRDAWEEYALEKAHALLIEDEFYFEEQNRNAAIWAVISAIVIVIDIVQLWRAVDPDPFWNLIYLVVALICFIAAAAIRIHGGFTLRRIAKRHKLLNKNGLKYL